MTKSEKLDSEEEALVLKTLETKDPVFGWTLVHFLASGGLAATFKEEEDGVKLCEKVLYKLPDDKKQAVWYQQDNSGQTPLHVLFSRPLLRRSLALLWIDFFLVHMDIDVFLIPDFDERSPIQLALESRLVPIVTYLLGRSSLKRRELDENIVENSTRLVAQTEGIGRTLLHYAVELGLDIDFIRFLVDTAGIDVQVADDDGKTAWMLAVIQSRIVYAKYLYPRMEPFEPNTLFDESGYNILHECSRSSELCAVEYLVNELHMSVQTCSLYDQCSPLDIACCTSNLPLISFYLQHCSPPSPFNYF